jgi:hypothetical protein
MHAQRWLRTPEAAAILPHCTAEECDRATVARGLCTKHYVRWNKGYPVNVGGAPHPLDGTGDWAPCVIAGCARFGKRGTHGMCSAHYQRARRNGDPGAEKPILVRGARRYIDDDGYVVIRADGHPNGGAGGGMFEHVRVMSDKIGRPLIKGETVHHRNGVRGDNRPENLELWSGMHPRGARVSDQIKWATEVIARYGSNPAAWEA